MMPSNPELHAERSVGELVAVLAQQMGTLVKQEVKLASAELGLKAAAVMRSSTVMLVGGVVSLLGLAALVAAAIAGLYLVLPLWAAALLVGVALAALGATLVFAGLAAFRGIVPLPTVTLRTLRDDVMWAKGQL